MKTFPALLLSVTLATALFVGCSGKSEPVAAQTIETSTGPVGRLLVITIDAQNQILMGGETYDVEGFTAAYPTRLGEMSQASTVLRVAPELSDAQIKPVLEAIAAAGVEKVYLTKIQSETPAQTPPMNTAKPADQTPAN